MTWAGVTETKVSMTGAGGFLGWHTRAALREHGAEVHRLKLGAAFDPIGAGGVLAGSTRVIHLAGVNRGTEEEVGVGNLRLAEQLASALHKAAVPPTAVVYANTTQAGNGTAYGEAKQRASDVLARAASEVGADFVDLRLPNLFGEHGRPFYNAVTATFSHLLAQGGEPKIDQDRDLTLLHAQDAAEVLIGAADPGEIGSRAGHESVSGLLAKLEEFRRVYAEGEIPDIASRFDRDLFNTYRSYNVEGHTPISLTRHADNRGSFFETVKSRGGSGQTSFSITMPGITRGDHFHRRKVERFVVLAGEARISLRRMFTDEALHFDVTGEEPVAIDMPTLWSHNITNTGSDPLYTMFWTNDLFDPARPDTIPEVV